MYLRFVFGFALLLGSLGIFANALQPEGTAQPFPLDGVIVVTPDRPTEPESWAAGKLQKVLQAMTQQDVPIFRDADAPRTTPSIHVGATRGNRNVPECNGIAPEGYAIVLDGETLRLAGDAAHGPVNAVLALLEEDLGWRWYSAYRPEQLPPPAQEIAVVPRRYAPTLRIRDPYYFESRADLEWSGENRIAPINVALPSHFGPTHCYVPHLFCHTLTRIMSYHDDREQLFRRKPEMFALIDGVRQRPPYNPCLSNPDTLALVTADVLAAALARPDCELISVSQGDGSGMFCQCDACKAAIAAEGESGLMLRFVNAVAREVAKKHPNVKISTLAYGETTKPPATVRPEPNVVIQLTDERLLADWSRIAPEIYLWYNWPICYKNLPLPAPGLPVAVVKLRRVTANPAVRGVMFNGDYLSPGASLAPLYAWVMAKQLWDCRRDTAPLIDDFCRGYYGNAAEPMREYTRLIFDSGLPTEYTSCTWDGISGCVERLRLTPEMLDRGRELLEQAKHLAADDPAVLREIEREELSWLYARLDAGVRNPADAADYRRDLARLRELVARFGVTHFNELEREMTVAGQLDRWQAASR